jgi:hypothetical protein
MVSPAVTEVITNKTARPDDPSDQVQRRQSPNEDTGNDVSAIFLAKPDLTENRSRESLPVAGLGD